MFNRSWLIVLIPMQLFVICIMKIVSCTCNKKKKNMCTIIWLLPLLFLSFTLIKCSWTTLTLFPQLSSCNFLRSDWGPKRPKAEINSEKTEGVNNTKQIYTYLRPMLRVGTRGQIIYWIKRYHPFEPINCSTAYQVDREAHWSLFQWFISHCIPQECVSKNSF